MLNELSPSFISPLLNTIPLPLLPNNGRRVPKHLDDTPVVTRCSEPIDCFSDTTNSEPSLHSLPTLHHAQVDHNTSRDNAPFPANAHVLEDNFIDHGQIDQRECQHEARHSSPKEELVSPDGLENRQRAAVLLRVHVEQAAGEVLGLPRGDEQQEREDGVGGCAGAEDDVARVVVARVAAVAERVTGLRDAAEHDRREHAQADEPHGRAVDELVDDELAREHADPQVVRRPLHHVRLGFFQP